MLKILNVFLSLVLASLLFACSSSASVPGQDESSSNEQFETEQSIESAMLLAYQEIKTQEPLLAPFVSYSENDDALVFNAATNQKKFEAIMEIVKPFVENDILVIDLREVEISSNRTGMGAPYKYLSSFPCKDLTLFFSPNWNFDSDEMVNIKTLTRATFTTNYLNEPLPQMPYLKELTIEFAAKDSLLLKGIEGSPQLEQLNFIGGPGLLLPDSSSFTTASGSIRMLEALTQLRVLELVNINDGLAEENLVAYAVICDLVKVLPSMEEIDGIPASSWSPSDVLAPKLLPAFKETRAMSFMCDIYERAEEGTIPTGGSLAITGKVMVLFPSSIYLSSPPTTMAGESFAGIEESRFTVDPAECAQVVFIYPARNTLGYWTNEDTGQIVGVRSRTYTYVLIYDVSSNTLSDPYLIGVTDPPEAGSSPSTESGIFLKDEALSFLESLF